MLAPPLPKAVRDQALTVAARAAILVEGWSDQRALQVLARRRGHDLDSERIVIVPTGGVTNVGKFAAALGPQGIGLRLAGLYDAPERRQLRSALRHAGVVVGAEDALETLGLFACDVDLRGELILGLSG